MTIAITAPQKFTFQDLVCIKTILRFCARAGTTLFVEPDGGEDAELTFALGARTVRYEIQVTALSKVALIIARCVGSNSLTKLEPLGAQQGRHGCPCSL
jgi:hypothetical protein